MIIGVTPRKNNDTMNKDIIKFWTLLAQMPGYDEKYKEVIKEAWVLRFSDDKTESLTELYNRFPGRFKAMIKALYENIRQDHEKAVKSARSAILHRLQLYGVNTADWNAVNTFMCRPQIAGKELYKMTLDELQALIPKLESILMKDAIIQREIRKMIILN